MKITTVIFMVTIFVLLSKQAFTQDSICATPQNETIQNSSAKSLNYNDFSSNSVASLSVQYTVNVAFHIINNSVSPAQTLQMITRLNEAFEDHGISFTKLCDNFTSSGVDQDLPYAINIYVFETLSSAPYARAVGSIALFISKNQATTTSLPHEMGHCLNLFHTHHNFKCEELIDGSNCQNCGDYVCDTPADPLLYNKKYYVDSNCNYESYILQNGQPFNPDTHNFMSYSLPECRNRFSPGQGARMRNALATLSILIPVTASPQIIGENLVCNSSTYIFKALGPVSWLSSNPSGLSINPSTGFASRQNNFSGLVTITATTSLPCGSPMTLTKQVWVGKPYLSSLTYDGMLTPNTCGTGLVQSITGGDHVLTATASGASGNPVFTLEYGAPYVHGGSSGNNFNFNVNNKHYNEVDFIIRSYFSNACGTVSSCTEFTNLATIVSPFPNPTSSEFTLQLGQDGKSKSIAVYNSKQQKVFSTETTEKDLTINTRELPEGNYVVKILQGGRSYSEHILIKH